jgi:hypothetical protein
MRTRTREHARGRSEHLDAVHREAQAIVDVVGGPGRREHPASAGIDGASAGVDRGRAQQGSRVVARACVVER